MSDSPKFPRQETAVRRSIGGGNKNVASPDLMAEIDAIETDCLLSYMLQGIPLREAVADVRRKRDLKAAGLDFPPDP